MDLHKKQPFDILFLDLELPCLSGVEVAKEIRTTSRSTVIIFLTWHREFGPEAYELKVFFYAMKPITRDKVKKLLIDAKCHLTSLGPNYAINTLDGLRYIPMSEILYLEQHGYQMMIHTRDGWYQSVHTLKAAEKELCASGFYRLHRSYIINMRFVTHVQDGNVFMGSDIRIPFGKTYSIRAFKAALNIFRLERLG